MNLEEKKTQALEEINNFHNLSQDQIKHLENFVAKLLIENQQFNFIGKSTVEDIWHRHILDSAQLINLIENKDLKFADFGTGAGLPGIVLSILGLKEMHLVEKAFRKADFLRRSRSISPNKIFVHQSKVEEIKDLKFDCIISRALAPLDKLLNFSINFLDDNGYCLFLKGRNLKNEIKSAKNNFEFDHELTKSLTSSESNIIKISNITKKGE